MLAGLLSECQGISTTIQKLVSQLQGSKVIEFPEDSLSFTSQLDHQNHKKSLIMSTFIEPAREH